MVEKGRISGGQMALLLFVSTLGITVATIPYLAAKWAKQDMWLTPVPAAVSGLVAFFIAYFLHRRFPGETVIQCCPRIFGWFGKVIALVFLVTYIHANSLVIRIYADFVNGVFLRETPQVVVMGGMVLLCAAAVRGGLETVARATQFLALLTAGILGVVTLLSMPEWEMGNVLPILEHDLISVARGAAAPASWFNDFFLAAFLLPFVRKGDHAARWGVVGVVGSMLVLMLFHLIILFIVGNQSNKFLFPLFEAFRLISLSGFLEHVDAFLLAIWLFIIFVKISLMHYTIVLGAAQWLGLSDYKPLSLPIALILIAVAGWTVPNLTNLNQFFDGEFFVYNSLVQIVIPLALLAVAAIRGQKGKRGEEGGSWERDR
ncbi:spore germination protein KB [Planifilum fimeticola]|uniref:Spore germination protein KB n=1 Tax=Planifilum fimeticola TaxID=201975 RepID=A0A2T0LDR9_9BACL|nr:endospore germination permease [Planifilum fimeticola]PRX40209.1 spore germination protein KB [Planifilum fimeticola]